MPRTLQADDARDGDGRDRATRRSGLATACLRGAIHDLRGPLNTLSLLHEVLRSSPLAGEPPQQEALAGATAALRQIDGMLHHLDDAATSMAPELRPVPLAPHLAAATRAVPGGGGVTLQGGGTDPADLSVRACPERLPLLLASLLRCGRGALPEGGDLRLHARCADGRAVIEVAGTGPTTAVPDAPAMARLTADGPDAPDWFALVSRAAGIDADLDLSTTPGGFSVRVCLPLATHPPTGQVPTC